MLSRSDFCKYVFLSLLIACSCEQPVEPVAIEPMVKELNSTSVGQQKQAHPEEPSPPIVAASKWEVVGPYVADVGRLCDGFPALDLSTEKGTCVGLVTHKGTPLIAALRGRFRPRSLVQDPSDDRVFWLIDAGARRSDAGRVLRIKSTKQGVQTRVVFSKLNRPHGSRIGPDGWVYVGLVDGIAKFNPQAPTNLQQVLKRLPTDRVSGSKENRKRLRMHPMRAFVFTPKWDLLVNMGSSSDRCEDSLPKDRCQEEEDHVAALWKYGYLGEGRWAKTPEYIAHGLRNSMALAVHPSGTILQAENGSDFSEVSFPHEELNVIEEGKHYGWPYCYDMDQRDPKWIDSSFDCSGSAEYQKPHALLPAHGAPLGMAYYNNEAIPELKGSLLIPLHGYREPGHRLLAFKKLSERGIPVGDFDEVIFGWGKKPSPIADTENPRGAPVDLTVARDGSVWMVEDKNGTVLRFARDSSAPRSAAVFSEIAEADAAGPLFTAAHAQVLSKRCAMCHSFVKGSSADALKAIQQEGWLEKVEGLSKIELALSAEAPKPMPPDGSLTQTEKTLVLSWIKAEL